MTVCLRSTGDVAAAAGKLCADARFAAGDRDFGRDRRAQADSEREGHARRAVSDDGSGGPPAAGPRPGTGRAGFPRLLRCRGRSSGLSSLIEFPPQSRQIGLKKRLEPAAMAPEGARALERAPNPPSRVGTKRERTE